MLYRNVLLLLLLLLVSDYFKTIKPKNIVGRGTDHNSV